MFSAVFCGRVVSALDYEAGNLGSIPGCGGTINCIISVMGGNLTEYCHQQYRPRLDSRGGNGTHPGLCWK